jgi:hypothetical protein
MGYLILGDIDINTATLVSMSIFSPVRYYHGGYNVLAKMFYITENVRKSSWLGRVWL